MSKNSQDGSDEYEVIFGDSKYDQVVDSPIENPNAEALDFPSERVQEAEPAEISNSDFFDVKDEDTDIEEGIFAPERKDRSLPKRSFSLMAAVSLFAFMGVGAFVYVSNPEIISKVTQNFGSETELTIPNDVDAGNVVEITGEAPPVTVSQHDIIPTKPISDSDDHQANDRSDIIIPTVESVEDKVVPSEVIDNAPNPMISEESKDKQDTQQIQSSGVPVVEGKGAVATLDPIKKIDPESVEEDIVKDVVKNTESPSVGTTSNVPPVTPDKPQSIDVTAKPSDTPIVISTPVDQNKEAKVLESSHQKDILNKGIENKKADPPQAVLSQEEQKRLDDANLDKYFDSPSGKILSDIPAPSMDPKKSSTESIIVVNKSGKRPLPPQQSGVENLSIQTTNLSSQMISANRALKLGRYDAAKDMYDELYRLNPKDGQILSGRALLLQKMGLADQAISAYEELLKLYPDNPDAVVNLAGLIRKQYPAVALNKLLDLHIEHPNNIFVTAQLGVAYADAGNYKDAIRYLGDAASMDPQNALHFYNLAVIYDKVSDFEHAVKYYEKSLEVDAIYGEGHHTISKERIYDRLAQIRGN